MTWRIVTKLGPLFAFYSGDIIDEKQDKPGKITDIASSGKSNCENRTLEVVGSTPIGSTKSQKGRVITRPFFVHFDRMSELKQRGR